MANLFFFLTIFYSKDYLEVSGWNQEVYCFRTWQGLIVLNTFSREIQIRFSILFGLMIGLRFNSYGMDFGMQIEAGWQLQVWFEHNGFILYPITPNFFG
ncbi:MAG: hypothetical protein NT084_15600, partial [Bacteroidetes bacterium]|nr:hypothetical protein [Bacteroidota bacterium]